MRPTGTLAACTVQTGDTDSGGETAGESGGTGGEPTEGPGTDGPCACIDPEQYARESYVCAEPSCGVVYVECDQTTEEEAAACFGDGHLVELDEAAFELAVLAFDHKLDGHRVAGLQRLLQVDQHHVVAAGLQIDRLARGKVETGDGAHLHHVAFHGHLVDLDHVGHGRRGRHELATGR